MDTNDANRLAHQLMNQHLSGLRWSFQFDNAKKRFGRCSYDTKTISISRVLTQVNSEAEVRDTILHEIAHALAGPGEGHGTKWKRIARQIGCTGQTTGSYDLPNLLYTLYCPNCSHAIPRARKTSKITACRRCCTKHSGGKFDSRFQLRWALTSVYKASKVGA